MRTVVEIGTAKGGTFYAWCRIAQARATIVSIDLPGGPFGGGYTLGDVKRFRKYGRKGQKLYFLRRDSHRGATKKLVTRLVGGRNIDFLMIDGDHRYSGVRRDWEMYAPLVKERGIIVLHDILFHPGVPACKVHRLWNEIKGRYRHKEFVVTEDDRGWGPWGGIGVLFNDAGRQSGRTRELRKGGRA